MTARLPAKRLASFYFFYYATVGAFMPYWSPYLEARGFSAVQMGLAYAVMGLSRSVVPLAWGAWADRRGARVDLIRRASLAALLLFLVIPFAPSVGWIAALMIGYTLFWHALLPQFEVVALNHLHASGGDYGRVRLWGSVGFVVAVLGLGAALDRTGILWLPGLVGVFWLGMAVTAWRVPEPPTFQGDQLVTASLRKVLRDPAVLALLLVCFASQLSFAPYYNFFTLFLIKHDYSRGFAGLLWALGVIAEIIMFMYMGRVIKRFGARKVMLAAMLGTGLRWLLTALAVDSMPVLLLVQISHALTFGAYHATAMHYVQRKFPGALHGRGQAVYNGVAYGLGGSIGSLVSGYLWESISPESVFLGAALVAFLGLAVAWRRLPDV
jgi:PPP family 3-phenylpropionic acid transporter